MDKKLFSVIVLCYRHFEYLFSAIDSVFEQDYPQIELIISDDGSKDFPQDAVENYLKSKKNEAIKSIHIHREEKNVGTVKHLNRAIAFCHGDYIVALAGDDMLFDKDVLTHYVNGFAEAPDNCFIQMAQTAMCDEKLKRIMGFFANSLVQAAIEHTKESTDELLRLLITEGPCLPSTSTCFKKEFFDRFGVFDEAYTLIEDYPMHMRLAEEGWIIHYNNFVAIKHRHGGISHGQMDALPVSQIAYYTDMRKLTNEIELKKLDVLPREEQARVRIHRKRELRWLDVTLAQTGGIGESIRVRLKYPLYFCQSILHTLWNWAYKWHLKALVYFLALRLFTPTIAEMVNTVFSVPIAAVLLKLYIGAGILLLVWVAAFVIWCANKLIWMIQRFPKEVLAIG